MTLHLTVVDLALVLTPVTSLLGLWLRLSWRTRQERARRETLVDLTHALCPGSELEETAADGTRLRITLTFPCAGRRGHRREEDTTVMTAAGKRAPR